MHRSRFSVSLVHSVFDNTITDDTVDDVVSTTMNMLRQSPQFNEPYSGNLHSVQNSRVHGEGLPLLRYHLLSPEIHPIQLFHGLEIMLLFLLWLQNLPFSAVQ